MSPGRTSRLRRLVASGDPAGVAEVRRALRLASTITDAAAMLGVTKWTLNNWLKMPQFATLYEPTTVNLRVVLEESRPAWDCCKYSVTCERPPVDFVHPNRDEAISRAKAIALAQIEADPRTVRFVIEDPWP